MTIDDLLQRFNDLANYPRVVGIDLSGSERRYSGFAILEGDHVETARWKFNEEIIENSIKSNPDLISIDAPLSLPKAGTTRECERQLRKRGIGVFPTLLPSMRNLTWRGMRLRQEFESQRFQVIESYPGAAQDILGIKRKGKGIEELKRGLRDFGLRGNFLSGKVSHDELDAITSALVGYFYLAGLYERLGNEEEGYLIIPHGPQT